MKRGMSATLDLTTSTLFVGAIERHAQICEQARRLNHMIPYRGVSINLGAALQILLRTLHNLHSFWRQKTLLTSADLERAGPGESEVIRKKHNINRIE